MLPLQRLKIIMYQNETIVNSLLIPTRFFIA